MRSQPRNLLQNLFLLMAVHVPQLQRRGKYDLNQPPRQQQPVRLQSENQQHLRRRPQQQGPLLLRTRLLQSLYQDRAHQLRKVPHLRNQ